ncbi:MAG: NAD(P)-dependent oxidoreductase [Pseudonocardia sp.]|nr:NAD(P)-dependent oxidoreductase [Pseudonocardia sp.]
MGVPMCTNLVRTGHEVIAHDLRQERRADVAASGAQWAATAAEAAAAADVLITMLPGPAEVLDAMVGAGDALRALRRGTTWVDTSSNTAASAEPIRLLAVERGVDVLDAPVGGGVAAAEDGTLAFFVGGSGEVLDRHRAVFDALGEPRRLVHAGGPGTGYTTKLLVNQRIHRRALSRYGPVGGELLAVALLEEEAGTTLRAGGHGAGVTGSSSSPRRA